MTISQFEASLSESRKLLAELGFLKMKGIKSVSKDGVSPEFQRASLKDDYPRMYSIGKKHFDFDILLPDESFFQFSYDASSATQLPDIRYAFFQNPAYYKTYEEYIEQLRADGVIENETAEEIGGMLLEEYDQFLLESQLNAASTMIRYDVDSLRHSPLIHSIAHFHIGHNTDIRIPCNKVLTPMKFVLFVLKHIYYYQWKEFIENKNTHLVTALGSAKNYCSKLRPPAWVAIEEQELFLD